MKLHPLVEYGIEKFEKHNSKAHNLKKFVNDEEANGLLNDIENFPHAYVLACCMDRQIKAEKAWMIPFLIKKNVCSSFTIEELSGVSVEEYYETFQRLNLHRFNERMPKIFFEAVVRIKEQYEGDAGKIWKGSPSSAAVVCRFLQFDGVGIKIATMSANLLARLFKIPFSDYCSIDVSPDVHVKRVMTRLGLVTEGCSIEEVVYKARELYPKFPGIIDDPLWEMGKDICRPSNPRCEYCRMRCCCDFVKKIK